MDSRDSEAARRYTLTYHIGDHPADTAAYVFPYYTEDHPGDFAPFDQHTTLASTLATAWLIQCSGGRAENIMQGSRLIFDEEELDIALEAISGKGVQPGTTPVDFAEQVIQEMGKE